VTEAGRDSGRPLLSVNGLRVEIAARRGLVVPSDDVSYEIRSGEVVGLVGESGCGKTMTALATIGLLPRHAKVAGGSIDFEGVDLASVDSDAMRAIRGGRIGYVPQNASTALNPVLRVGTQLDEILAAHMDLDKAARRHRSIELLASVGIPDPASRLDAYPAEFSGGMRQRVAIAIALSCDPALIIADEPTTALDATVQAQVIELIGAGARQRGAAVLLISHDLGLVSRVTDRTMVMYAGRMVEVDRTQAVTGAPQHPYTEGLLAATPRVGTARISRFQTIPGVPPDLADPPPACRFAARCRYARERCTQEEPRIGDLGVACWYPASTRAREAGLESQRA
jgi:oligopeptide/dipeptide ABC transporter ATP-binding protein